MNITTTNYQTGYEKTIAELTRNRERVDALKPDLDVCEEVRLMFPNLDMYVSCGYSVHTLDGALLMVSNLENIRDILPVGAALSARGYKPKGHSDYAEMGRRTYDYGNIKLSAFLKPNGAKCEFKQTGVKETPVFELVCADTGVIE